MKTIYSFLLLVAMVFAKPLTVSAQVWSNVTECVICKGAECWPFGASKYVNMGLCDSDNFCIMNMEMEYSGGLISVKFNDCDAFIDGTLVDNTTNVPWSTL